MVNETARKVPRSFLPKWASGIVRRQSHTGELVDIENLDDWIKSWISTKLGISADAITSETPFVELGLDSLAAIELSGRLEEVTGKSISPSAAWEYPTVTELVRHLRTSVSESRSDMDGPG